MWKTFISGEKDQQPTSNIRESVACSQQTTQICNLKAARTFENPFQARVWIEFVSRIKILYRNPQFLVYKIHDMALFLSKSMNSQGVPNIFHRKKVCEI